MVQLCSHRAQRPSRHEGGTGLSYAPLRGMRNVRIADTLPVGAPSGPSNIRTPTGYSPLPGIEMRARPALPPATLASTETGAGSAWKILGPRLAKLVSPGTTFWEDPWRDSISNLGVRLRCFCLSHGPA